MSEQIDKSTQEWLKEIERKRQMNEKIYCKVCRFRDDTIGTCLRAKEDNER